MIDKKVKEKMCECHMSVIFCPPLSKYPVKPDDISASTIEPCPTCKGDMWYSEKKKEVMRLAKERNHEIIFECHDCFYKRVQNDREYYREYFKNHEMVRI